MSTPSETRSTVFDFVTNVASQCETVVVCITIHDKKIWVYVPQVLPKIAKAIENMFYKYYTESEFVDDTVFPVEVLNKDHVAFGELIGLLESTPIVPNQRWLVVAISKESVVNIVASGKRMMDEDSRIAFCSDLLDFVTSHAFDTIHINHQVHYEFLDDILRHRVDVSTIAADTAMVVAAAGHASRLRSSETIMIYGRKEK